MNQDDYSLLSERYSLLQARYLKLKEEVERFLKKRSGYKELKELLKEISS